MCPSMFEIVPSDNSCLPFKELLTTFLKLQVSIISLLNQKLSSLIKVLLASLKVLEESQKKSRQEGHSLLLIFNENKTKENLTELQSRNRKSPNRKKF